MDRQILNITANEQILTCDNPIKISTNKVNYIEVHFTLGDNWSGYDSVRAVWFNDFYCISTVLDSNGVAFVPSEVMKRNGKVKVNLVGSISENDVLTDRLTSYPIVAVIVDCTAQINGAETAPITPSQFEQYVAIVRSLVDSVKDIDHIELNPDYTLTIYYSDGTSDTTTSIRGEQGDTGNGIASIELNSDYTLTINYTDGTSYTTTSIRGAKGDKGDTGEVSLSELEQATVVQTLSDNEPYNYRRTNNGNGSGHREYDEIVGASVGWNQLVNTTDTSVIIQSGHKYYSNINNVKTIGLSNGTAISINDGTKDNIIDLTLFNSAIADYVYSLEQSTAGSGVTWLKTHFPKLFDNGYQPFDSGSIKSVSGLTAHEMVGKNLFDVTANPNKWVIADGTLSTVTGAGTSDKIETNGKVLTFTASYANGYSGILCVAGYDSSDNLVHRSAINGANSITFTTTAEMSYVRASHYNNADFQLEFGSTATDFEPHESHTYPLDSSVTLRGQYKLNNGQLKAVGDVWTADGQITRKYGTRAYQSGDESDATVVTDGTTTVYPLTTPTTENAPTYDNPQWCDSKGTEEYVGSELPVGHNTDYPMSLVDTMPTTNGTFEPRVTVTNGVRTVTWVSV